MGSPYDIPRPSVKHDRVRCEPMLHLLTAAKGGICQVHLPSLPNPFVEYVAMGLNVIYGADLSIWKINLWRDLFENAVCPGWQI